MAATFTRNVLKILSDNGCSYVRTGRYPVHYGPITNRNFPVPNGIRSARTANVVLKQAGLPKVF